MESGVMEPDQRATSGSLPPDAVAALKDARRKVKGAAAELSIALATIDRLLKINNTTPV